jgi:hypothetical protein
MICDKTVIIKVNSSTDNKMTSRHVKRRLKSVGKMRNSGVIALDYIQTSKNLENPFTVTKCDRKCIEGNGYETHNISCPQW